MECMLRSIRATHYVANTKAEKNIGPPTYLLWDLQGKRKDRERKMHSFGNKKSLRLQAFKMEPTAGVEPATYCLRNNCSTN